jgi:hypothetical protein
MVHTLFSAHRPPIQFERSHGPICRKTRYYGATATDPDAVAPAPGPWQLRSGELGDWTRLPQGNVYAATMAEMGRPGRWWRPTYTRGGIRVGARAVRGAPEDSSFPRSVGRITSTGIPMSSSSKVAGSVAI